MKEIKTCSLCKKTSKVINQFEKTFDAPLLKAIQDNNAEWNPDQGVCLSCLDEYHQKVLQELIKLDKLEGYTVLPTPIRLNAHPDYSGLGVTICFIDSGFFLHPDLISPKKRIKEIVDITQPNRSIDYFKIAHENAWHGTMTSVVCAGNGHLSNGVFKGIAHNADLVLLKVMDDNQKISEDNIVKALKWVLKNHEEQNIKIVNISVTGDTEISYKKSEIDQLIKQLFEEGINVVAAVGNDTTARILPPANSPEVIAVGGLDDRNTLDPFQQNLYHSTYGFTIDGLTKPELIAPAIWIAAPILPTTKIAQEAQKLFEELASDNNTNTLEQIKNKKLVSPHYQYADGTSFAAPIVCSVMAQMLEANPKLSPLMIREILLSTARTIPSTEKLRQGYGVIQAGYAVAKSINETDHKWIVTNPVIDYSTKKITFRYHHHEAKQVYLTGNFINWNPRRIPLLTNNDGEWEIEIPLLSKGEYAYKFVVDDDQWITDPLNYYRIPDGYNNFNSRFFIS